MERARRVGLALNFVRFSVNRSSHLIASLTLAHAKTARMRPVRDERLLAAYLIDYARHADVPLRYSP